MPAADEGRRLAGPQDVRVACCTCGYEWVAGQDGSHSCSHQMAGTIARLTAERDEPREEAERMRAECAKLARRTPLYDGGSEPADEELAQAIDDLPLPTAVLAEVRRQAAEIEQLRAALAVGEKMNGGAVTVCQRPCRCGGCADSGCPGRGEG